MGIIDELPKRNVIYQGNLDALADKYDLLLKQGKGQYLGRDQECAALPQFLTNVGYTGRWQPGPRVIDLAYLNPGTVIANFKFVDGKWMYPNEHGYHAGLFDKFWHGAMMVNGLPCKFSIFDQFPRKPAGRRGVAILPPEWKKANPRWATPSNMADEFYVVVVP